ncbi:hypothetical protein [Desulfosediminicola flagellatus]|uniref:hypothetical protein n=1 Tax=Desulfosediminicola flagellatus TaxID=2569541 RepID=UPI0010AD58CE|nr:hypothetical protein [Desulfosediminicola flagellatus]
MAGSKYTLTEEEARKLLEDPEVMAVVMDALVKDAGGEDFALDVDKKTKVVQIDSGDFKKAFGISDPVIANIIGTQILKSAPNLYADEDGHPEAIVMMLKEFKPRDGVEAMLAAQAILVHFVAMHQYSKVQVADYVDNAKAAIDTGIRLTKTFTGILEALDRYRGKAAKQKIVVERVVVTEGGQAVVGSNIEGGS